MNERNDTDDGLRDRLAAADPARRASIEPIPLHLMEHVMTTTLSQPASNDEPAPARRRNRWKLPAVLGGVAAATAVVAGVAALRDDGSTTTAPLVLSGGGDALASCMPFSTEILAEMPTALEGTVTAVDGPTVTLTIDRWYHDSTNSSALEVVVNAPQGMEALIGGVAFETGNSYLITADTDGNVNYCGYSAPATDELRAAFDEAFPG